VRGTVEGRLGSLALTVAAPSCWRVLASSEGIFGRDILAGEHADTEQTECRSCQPVAAVHFGRDSSEIFPITFDPLFAAMEFY
jgi:hypothetical protein